VALEFIYTGLDRMMGLANILLSTFTGILYVPGNFGPSSAFMKWRRLDTFLGGRPLF